MNPSQEVAHIRSHWRQLGPNEAEKIPSIEFLRNAALRKLEPIKAKIVRPLSSFERELWLKRGTNLEWDMNNEGDALAFKVAATYGETHLSAGEMSAALLLCSCNDALKRGALPQRLAECILDAYVGICLDDLEVGQTYRVKQAERARKPRGKVDDGYGGKTTISLEVEYISNKEEHKAEKAKGLWGHLFSRLDGLGLSPTEYYLNDDIYPSYSYDFGGRRRTISFKRFETSVSRHRRKKDHDNRAIDIPC